MNEQAIVLEFGKPVKHHQRPGLYWKIPVVQTVDYFDKRILDLDTAPQEVTASDQKRIVVDAFARYRITDPLLFYQTVRDERNVRSRLGPIIESALRRVLGAVDLPGRRARQARGAHEAIAQQVNEEGKEFGLEVVDVRIKRADLPEQNSKNIFDRMRAERQREAAEFRAEGAGAANRIRANADREVTIIKAEATREGERTRGEGDAERNRIFAEAFGRDPDFFGFYRSMQAYERASSRATRACCWRRTASSSSTSPIRRSEPTPHRALNRSDERSSRCDRAGDGDRGSAVGRRAAAGPASSCGGGADAGASAARRGCGGGCGRVRDRLAGAWLRRSRRLTSAGVMAQSIGTVVARERVRRHWP